MSPTNHACANQLKHIIYYNLDLGLLDTALFLASRLLAYEPRASEAAYLVALCNLRLQRYKPAYEYSKISGTRGTHLGCAYVFAQACLSLGRYQEGTHAIERLRGQWKGRNNWGKHTDTRRQPLPDAPAFLCLLGHLHRALEDVNKASECYSESLRINPFMWEAFTALCDLGANVRVSKVFNMNQELLNVLGSSEEVDPTDNEAAPTTAVSAVAGDPFTVSTSRANVELRNGIGKSTLSEKFNGAAANPIVTIIGDDFDTPSNTNVLIPRGKEPLFGHSDVEAIEPPQAPLRRNRTILGAGTSGTDLGIHGAPRIKPSIPKLRKFANESEEADGGSLGIAVDRKRTVSGHAAQSGPTSTTIHQSYNSSDPMAPTARRSVRILNSSTSRPQSRLGGTSTTATVPRDTREVKRAKAPSVRGRANVATVGRVVSGNRKHEPMDVDAKEFRALSSTSHNVSKPAMITSDKNKDVESLHALLEGFRTLAGGYFALSQFRCQEAITIFSSLPQAQRDTPWVLSQMARAYFEQSSWAEAEKLYNRVRAMAPVRIEDLEFHSSVLWHLKRDVELSFLAHEIMDLDRLSPEAWCIVGNSLSLQRDHEGALKCFKRASQLDPKFAYAYTLQGHEHIAGEEYDKALEAYRSGVAADPRHYNSWYGLGVVYEKQGRFDVAETHYRVAISINPTNAILLCCVGAIMEKMKKMAVALGYYNRATELAPKSTLARYKKSRVLLGMGEVKKSLSELLVLKDLAPEDPNVHFLLGKVYKMLHDNGSAIKHFTTAMNLEPKAQQHIKEAMEQLEDDLEDDELMT